MYRIAWLVLWVAGCGDREAKPPPPAERPHALPEPGMAEVPPPPTAAPRSLLECFAPPLRFAVADHVSSLTVADFDRDARPDVLVTYVTLDGGTFQGQLVVHRGTGDGNLALIDERTAAGDMVYAVSAGDIDGDGNVDVAVGDPRGKRVLLYAGRGDGRFTPKPALATGRKGYGAKLADLDGDKRLDLIVELFSAIQIYGGDGKFGFRRRATVQTGQAPDGPAVGDLDGDGSIDLAYASNDDHNFFTLLGKRGQLRPGVVNQPSCVSPGYTSGGDVDDDGDLDVTYNCTDHFELRLNDGRGVFRLVTSPFGGGEQPIVIADLTGDGKTDLLVSQRPDVFSGRLVLLESDGTGNWRVRTQATVAVISGVGTGDFDGDQRRDLVVATWTGNVAELLVLLARDCSAPP